MYAMWSEDFQKVLNEKLNLEGVENTWCVGQQVSNSKFITAVSAANLRDTWLIY